MLRVVRVAVSLFFLTFMTALLVQAGTPSIIDIPLIGPDTNYAQVDGLFTKPVILNSVSYEGDVILQRDELDYLIGLAPGDSVTSSILKQALAYIAKKNKFSTLRLHRVDLPDGTIDLVWSFESGWTFKKLKIFGIRRGKDQYQQLYLLKPGELFDEVQHNHSVDAIKEALKKSGYLNARITSSLVRDPLTKSVVVQVIIESRDAFKIDKVVLSIKRGLLSHDEHEQLYHGVDHICRHHLQGKYYTKSVIDKQGKAINRLLVKHGFLQSDIELKEEIDYFRGAVLLNVTVDPQIKREFVFFGNHFFSDTQLLDVVLQFGQSVWLIPLSLLTEELERAYHKKGFLDVAIESRQEDDVYFFVITEGDRARVGNVEVRGQKQYESSFLVCQFFSYFTKGHHFDIEKFKPALDGLISWYKGQGFWNMKVVKHQCERRNNEPFLLLHLDEGMRTYFFSVRIPGFEHLEQRGPFFNILNTDAPLPFGPQELQNQRQWLLQHLRKQGYLYATVDHELESNIKDGEQFITVVWHINLCSEPVRFGKTIINGAVTFPFHRIVRELDYKKGDVWSKEALERSFRNLRDLDIFESVHLYPYNIARCEPEKTILLNLVQDEPFEVRARAGVLGVSKNFSYRDGATYKFGGTFIYKNPFSSGGRFFIDGDVTRFERRVGGSYQFPWTFGFRLKTEMKGYSNRYKQPIFVGSKETLYEVDQHGFLFGCERPFPHGTFAFNSGTEWLKMTKINRTAAAAINFAPELIDEMVPYLFTEPTVVFDFLDNKLNPTTGSFTLLSLKGMVSFKQETLSFLRVMAEQSFFVPFGADVVAGLRLRFGHIFNQSFPRVMPPERFYLGGAYSVRGYETDLAPPLGSYCRNESITETVPQGGKTMVNGNLEFRFPLYGRVGGSIFQDVGLLVGDNLTTNIRNEGVAATGIGLRYDTPIGPFRLDLGLRWRSTARKRSRAAWFFTLGNAF